MIQPLWRTVWRFLKKLQIELPYDPANFTFGYISEKRKKHYFEKIHTSPVFIAALFTIAKIWKQRKCPSTEQWIKKMGYMYTMEYYTAIKVYEILPFATTWMDLEGIMLNEISQTEKDNYCMISHICGI